MQKRFYHESSRGLPGLVSSCALFCLLFFLFLSALSSLFTETKEKQAENLRLSISRSIVRCYAYEGHYPESLEYLKEHYGIWYDPDTFFVDYQVLGENIFPDVTIIEK